MTFHHLVFDAVTAYQVLLPELEVLYDAFAAGRSSPLPEPLLQYGDFAYWQRRELETETLVGTYSLLAPATERRIATVRRDI